MKKIETDLEYQNAIERYEQIKYAKPGTKKHKEKIELVAAIAEHENNEWNLPEPERDENGNLVRDKNW